VPLKFLKALLPDPGSLGPLTKGRTCIGCLIKGIRDGREKQYYIYNICDHQEAASGRWDPRPYPIPRACPP
jgi:saccharopine dehydrogenase (NAD+, L-lysine forming)